MSDPQYWASLRGLGLAIFLFIFVIFLVLVIFGSIYGRISVWQIWSAPFWLKYKIPLIIIGIIGFIGSMIAFARYEARLELRAVQEYAQAQGWGFARFDSQGLKERIDGIWWDLNFNPYYIRTVETGQRSLYLFECSYKRKQASGRTSNYYATACLVHSDRFRSVTVPVEIVPRDWTEVITSDKVAMGDSPFTEKFLVLSENPGRAREIVNESIQSILLEHDKKPLFNPVKVAVGPAGAVLMADRTFEHERLQDLLALALRIESAVE
jgi:hypothetical protein